MAILILLLTIVFPLLWFILLNRTIQPKELSFIKRFFLDKHSILLFYIGIFLLIFLYNHYYQIFCIPVPYFKILIIICSTNLLVSPFLKAEWTFIKGLSAYANGISIVGCLYLIIFWYDVILYGLIFCIFLIPYHAIFFLIATFLKKHWIISIPFLWHGMFLSPFIFLWQITKEYKQSTKWQKMLITLGLTLTLSSIILLEIRLRELSRIIETASVEQLKTYTNPIDLYLLEGYLGLHWKYHTRFTPYDGFRPPFHDPIFAIGSYVIVDKSINTSQDFDWSYDECFLYYQELFGKPLEIPSENKCECGKSKEHIIKTLESAYPFL